MSYDPYALFEDTAEAPSQASPASAPTSPVTDPYALFEETAPTAPAAPQAAVQAPTAAPEDPSVFSQVFGTMDDALGLSSRAKTSVGIGEAGLSLLSGMAGQAVGGLAGIGETVFGGGALEGADTVKAVQEAMTYQPRTEAGDRTLQAFGGALEPVADVITAASEGLGDTAYNVTGSPAVAAAFYTVPDAVLEVTGLGLAGKASRTARLAKESKKVNAATELLAEPANRVADPIGGQWKLDAEGVAVPNTTGIKLTDSGIMSGAEAALVTNSNKATKVQMKAMTDAFNKRAEGIPTSSPAQIIGANAGRALTEANNVRKGLGQKMDAFVKGEKGATVVDSTPAINNFYSTLSEMGISGRPNVNTGKIELDFRNSDISGKTFAGARRLLQDGFDMTVVRGKTTLADVHKMKKSLDNLLDAKKLEQGGELGNVERKLLELRSGLNEAAGQVDGYRQLNQQYAAVLDGLSNFDSFRPAGKSWDSPAVMNNVGAGLKSASADTAKVNNMLEGLTGLNQTLSEIGAKPFSVDVVGLARYSDFLNSNWSRSVMDAVPQGGWWRGARQNAQGAALSAMVGNKFGVANNMSGLVANGIDAKAAASAAKKAKENQGLVLKALSE